MNAPAQTPSATNLTHLLAKAPRAVTVRLLDPTRALITCRDRSASITRESGQWLASHEVNGNRIDVRHPLEDWGDVTQVFAWVAGPHVVDASGDVQRLTIGTLVEVDSKLDDAYDRGKIESMHGSIAVYVSWERADCVQSLPPSALDGLIIHEPGATIHWWHEWPVDEEAAETEAKARAMDEAAWRADRGCR